MKGIRICKDCSTGSKRPAPNPGPRCASHWREIKKARKDAAHEKMVASTYGLKPGEYNRLYELQGGKCYICQRSNGRTRKLSVDHCHKSGRPRGLLCRPCNNLLGWLRDDPEAFLRGHSHLTNPVYDRLYCIL